MSIDATRWAWKLREVKPTQKLVLLSLADRADENHCCWPSLRRLAFDTGLDERTINTAIKNMCDAGFIKRIETPGRGYTYYLVGVNGRENSSAPCAPPATSTPPNQCRGYKIVPPSTNAPALDAGGTKMTPLTGCTPPPSKLQGDPPHFSHSLHIIESKEESKRESKRKKNIHARDEKKSKLAFGEFGNVFLTQAEHDKLIADHGERGKEAIQKLDVYLGSTGKHYKSHYMAIHSWVFRAVDEDRTKKTIAQQRASPRSPTPHRIGMSQHGNAYNSGEGRVYEPSDFGILANQ